MAIELNTRTKIIAGVAVLALAGAGAWFFYFQDEPPPPPPQADAKPAADASKAVGAPKPAADAAKAADAPKAAATESKPAAAKPAPKPIPGNPDLLIAEVIETSGLKTYFQTFAREAMLKAAAGSAAGQPGLSAAEAKQVIDMVERVFDSSKISSELAPKLKSGFNAERMVRYLELLRQPISLKMTSQELRNVPQEAIKEHSDKLAKEPLSAERAKLVQALDETTRTSEVGADMVNAMARNMVDAMLDALQKSVKNVSKETRQTVGSQLNTMRSQSRNQIRTVMSVIYRNVSDEELSEYAKLLDNDTGRWGSELLAEAIRPGLVTRGSALGRELAPIALAKLRGAIAKTAPEEQPAAKAEVAKEKPVEKPAASEPVAYQRPANIRELYTRYNDLVTAVVMRDRAAVKELLGDGKDPNVRQSDGSTPLMVAAFNGDADLTEMLLAKGADPNLRARGGATALSIAKERRRADLVRLLERHGAKN